MENQNKKSRYVIIGGERVFLNPAQQKAWDKFINDARNKARRNGTCGQPNYRLCFGDCACCPYQIAGRMVSIDDKQDYYVIVFKKKCVDTFYSYFESLTIFKKSSKKPTVEKNRFTPYK